MWTYSQATGTLMDRHGVIVAHGYSGHGEGKNNPAMQTVKATGPIPVGMWRIGKPYDSDKVGPFALPLTPMPGTNAFGRTAFRIHGDSIKAPGTASHGCIIVPRAVRSMIVQSGDLELLVTV